MLRRSNRKELAPGSHTHDAAVIAHLGRIYLTGAAVVGCLVESTHLVSDLISEDGIRDELVSVAQWSMLGGAAFVGFGAFQHHFERRTEQIRANSVTD